MEAFGSRGHRRQDNYPGKIKRVKRIFQAEGAARNGQQF